MDITSYLDQHENKSLLRVLTCGSVDDGKSTLIGRLLYDSKLIFTDQLQALEQASQKNGTTGAGNIDYALLLDGLKAEREQGITIDVAYRYFTTPKRKFIIADCPGHEQYTRNMATGASTANLAIILIDARHGVLTQTKRHAYIVSLLGIQHLLVAVNKMDLFDYDQTVFEKIQKEFSSFAKGLNLPDIRYIPISALAGENVVEKSSKISWYEGPSLLDILEEVDTSKDLNYEHFRFPVQVVSRPDLNFRGFAGSIASGTVDVGDEIVTLPSLKTSKVKRILTADGDLNHAFAPLPVTIELEDEIDISSGDLIVKKQDVPQVSRHFSASIVWMAESPLKVGNQYLIRHSGRNVAAKVVGIEHEIDINTLDRKESDHLALNQVGLVRLETKKPIYADLYDHNKSTGAFVLIDLVTNNTVGAGRIDLVHDDALLSGHDPYKKLRLETRRRHLDKNLLFGKGIFIAGSDLPEVKSWARQLDNHLFQQSFNTHYLGAEDDQVSSDQNDTLIQISQLLGITGTLAITALSHLPDENGIKALSLTSSQFKPLNIWLGDKISAPKNADLVISPSENPINYSQQLLDILRSENEPQVV